MIKSKYDWQYIDKDGFKYDNSIAEPEIVQKILYNRGIYGKKAIEEFMNPSLGKLYDPFLLMDMSKAVERVLFAKENNERVTIYGDYDVDGITSTSLLLKYLRKIGLNVEYYIPNRMEEGYGINKNALNLIKDNGASLVITVDTGIAAVSEVEYAKEIGLDVIITDHHECQDEIPKAYAVINPKIPNSKYPFSMLAGVGVTFKFVQAIATKLNDMDAIWEYLDLVAIGTIADIVPLVDENRIIAKYGFKKIEETNNVGLQELLKIIGYKNNNITSSFIGFILAPRLNAAGRIDDANKCVRLFITEDREEAYEIAKELEKNNQDRQLLEQQIFEEAVEMIESSEKIKASSIIVLAKENWHHGVIGIVASKILERYYRPVILMNKEEGELRGSARSIVGFSIFEALQATKSYLKKFGGHEMAAGLSLENDKLDEFRVQIETYTISKITNEMLIPKARVDMKLDCKDITPDFINNINKLQPYGVGNFEPIFEIEGKVEDFKLIGKESNHLKLKLKQNNAIIDAIMFNSVEHYGELDYGLNISIIGSLQNNEWNGNIYPQILIKDFKEQFWDIYIKFKNKDVINSSLSRSEFEVTRENIAKVYKCLLKKDGKHSVTELLNEVDMNLFKLFVITDILNEENLARIEIMEDSMTYNILPSTKIDITKSKILIKLNNALNNL